MTEIKKTPKQFAGAQTVERALVLLRMIANDHRPVAIGELCQKTGLNRSTVYRLLTTLENSGFLERDIATKGYQLGYTATSLCTGINQQYAPLIRLARPTMEVLRDQTQETVILAVPRFSGILTIDQLDSPKAVRLKNYLDEISPLHCSSNGKVLLSLLPPLELEHAISGSLEKSTPYSTVDTKVLLSDIERIRKTGYGMIMGELDENENGISTAILDHDIPIAFLSVAGPSFRFSKKIMTDLAPTLLDAAKKIAAILPQ